MYSQVIMYHLMRIIHRPLQKIIFYIQKYITCFAYIHSINIWLYLTLFKSIVKLVLKGFGASETQEAIEQMIKKYAFCVFPPNPFLI